MATMKDLARDYAQRIKSAPVKFREADVILREINRLIYESSNLPISAADKEEIINEIYSIFQNEGIVYKSADNRNYLQLIQYMLAQIKPSGGK
jgi:hypothetical protein